MAEEKKLFNKEEYDEIMDILKNLYLDLFKTMLDYKNKSYKGEEDNFEYLDSLVRLSYPQFSSDLIHISVLRNEPHYTYFERIRAMLLTYVNLKNMYNNTEFEKKYFSSDENTGEDVIDDYEVCE